MLWLIVAILSYFFLALVSLFDRYLLVGPIPNPKTYTFYVGICLLLICFILIPFGIHFPEKNIIFLGLITGLIRIFAILFLTKSVIQSEISRVIPAIGGFLPIFTFLLFFLFLPQGGTLTMSQIIAFILLIFGSVLISLKKFSLKLFTLKNLKYPIITAFLFALTFFLTKIIYLKLNFFSGFFLILLGGGLGAIGFLILPQTRREIFAQKPTLRVSGLFILGQIVGGLGVLSQFYAIFLAKPDQVPLINSLEGIRYVFLLFFVFLLSRWKPEILKEEMKGINIFQKILAILFIGIGLAILALS